MMFCEICHCLCSKERWLGSSDLIRFCLFFFFFNDTATTEIYTLSLHDALPIWLEHGVGPGSWCWSGRWSGRARRRRRARRRCLGGGRRQQCAPALPLARQRGAAARRADRGLRCLARTVRQDRKSTRLNSSHLVI